MGSIASLGLPKIEALGGARLMRPLVWLLRQPDQAGRFAAMRALMFLADEPACRHVLGGVRARCISFEFWESKDELTCMM